MARYSESRPHMANSQMLHDSQCSSSTTLRTEPPSKTPFSNQIPVTASGGSGRMLKKPAGSIIALVFEIFLCLVALCFVALGIIALCIRNRPTGDDLGNAMEQAMKLGPTIYPILFAALLSRSLKSIGRYCAQRSVQMSTLWALMNTNATADPILHIASMPASILVWGLLALWAMSPLGGQSTIRLMYKINETDITHPQLRYWDSGPLGNMLIRVGIMEGNDGSWPLSMKDMYSASLMQSADIKSGPLDQWGNVKIPRIEAGNASDIDSAGWMSVNKSLGPEAFTSLFGMPIVGLPEIKKRGDLNFTIEMAYVVLSPPSTWHRDRIGNGKGLEVECVDCFEWGPEHFIRSQKFAGLPPDGYYTEINDTSTPEFTEPRTLRFNSSIWDTSVTTCQVTQRMVEALVECVDGHCMATKVRPSLTDHRPKNFTSFDYWAWIVLDMISHAAYQHSPSAQIWNAGSSTLFLNDSSAFPIQTGMTGQMENVNVSLIDPGVFSTRASILLNTGLQAFMAPMGFSGQLPTNLSLYGPPHIPGDGVLVAANVSSLEEFKNTDYNAYYPPDGVRQVLNDGGPFVGASTNATLARYTEVYRPDYAWAVILIVSSLLLFSAGVAGIGVRLKTLAPNMFDPVIGLTYGNPYISLTGRDDNPLDADERANVFGSKKVQLGEVDDYKGVKAVFGEAGYVTPLRLGVPYH